MEPQFAYTVTRDDVVTIFFHKKVVTTLKGKAAIKFLNAAACADEETLQHLMARATGNFKRGNER